MLGRQPAASALRVLKPLGPKQTHAAARGGHWALLDVFKILTVIGEDFKCARDRVRWIFIQIIPFGPQNPLR